MAAKFLHPLLFCNDVNIKTLIDITLYDVEHLLITCKSFTKRFNLSARSQVDSWITKSWQPFTCGAVKGIDTDKIFVVINYTHIYSWAVEEKDIQNSKKYGFKSKICSLIATNKQIYIVYSSGFVETLDAGLKKRKEVKSQVIKQNEIILQSQVFQGKNSVAILVKSKVDGIVLYHMKIGSTEILSRSEIKLPGCQLKGSLMVPTGKLYTIWSNGKLYSADISENCDLVSPGNVKGIISLLEKTKQMSIVELSSNHIAIQGMNVTKDGSLVVLFDTKFGVCVSSKPMKMYKDPPLSWSVPSGIVVGDGGSLVFVPVALSQSTVASMLGSRLNENTYYDVCVDWGKGAGEVKGELEDPAFREIPLSATWTVLSNKSNELSEIIKKFNQGSISEDIIVDEVVSEIINLKNIKLISECLSSFDIIPEKSLVALLKFVIEAPEEIFPGQTLSKEMKKSEIVSKMSLSSNKNVEKIPNGFKIDLKAEGNATCNVNSDASTLYGSACPFSKRKRNIINQILNQPFSVKEITEEMMTMDFKNSLVLIHYLHYLLVSGKSKLLRKKGSSIPTVEKVCLWLSFALDVNYHQLVMTSEIEIHKMLLRVFDDIASLVNFWEATYSIDILVDRVRTSKLIPTAQGNNSYCMEKTTFF